MNTKIRAGLLILALATSLLLVLWTLPMVVLLVAPGFAAKAMGIAVVLPLAFTLICGRRLMKTLQSKRARFGAVALSVGLAFFVWLAIESWFYQHRAKWAHSAEPVIEICVERPENGGFLNVVPLQISVVPAKSSKATDVLYLAGGETKCTTVPPGGYRLEGLSRNAYEPKSSPNACKGEFRDVQINPSHKTLVMVSPLSHGSTYDCGWTFKKRGGPGAGPCDKIDRDLRDKEKTGWVGPITLQLRQEIKDVKKVEVLRSFRSGTWRIIEINTFVSDEPFLFYSGDPLKTKYVKSWSGAARTDEEQEITNWVLANVRGIPKELASCFGWYVSKGRE